jgi:hypothetical protein
MTTDQLEALECLLKWATGANQRLAYEKDRESGFQFGGNPYCNPVLKKAGQVLTDLRNALEDADRETVAEGDSRYYTIQSAGIVWGPEPYMYVSLGGVSQQGTLTGTALALMDGWAKTGERSAWLVMLDRIQEAPEEVVGMDIGAVLAGIEWLRNH